MVKLLLATYDLANDHPMTTLASAMAGGTLIAWFYWFKPWHDEYAEMIRLIGS